MAKRGAWRAGTETRLEEDFPEVADRLAEQTDAAQRRSVERALACAARLLPEGSVAVLPAAVRTWVAGGGTLPAVTDAEYEALDLDYMKHLDGGDVDERERFRRPARLLQGILYCAKAESQADLMDAFFEAMQAACSADDAFAAVDRGMVVSFAFEQRSRGH